MCVYLYTQLIYTVHIYIMHTKIIILECDLIRINHCLALIIILYYIRTALIIHSSCKIAAVQNQGKSF